MNIEIKLFQRTVDGKTIDWPEFPQRNVFLNGRRIAYCGSKAGMPINFLKDVGEDIRKGVKAAVEAYHGGESGRMVDPAPIIPNEEMDNDDE